MRESSFDAWGEVRGKPSRMKDASGEDEGEAGPASAREVLGGTHDLAFSSERMRRRIMSSGTREPDCMWDSASWPAVCGNRQFHSLEAARSQGNTQTQYAERGNVFPAGGGYTTKVRCGKG